MGEVQSGKQFFVSHFFQFITPQQLGCLVTDPYFGGDGKGGVRVVTGNHNSPDPCLTAAGNGGSRFVSGWIHQTYKAGKDEIFLWCGRLG